MQKGADCNIEHEDVVKLLQQAHCLGVHSILVRTLWRFQVGNTENSSFLPFVL